MNCPKCNAPLGNDDIFCTVCGSRVEKMQFQVQQPVQQIQQQSSKVPAIVAIVVVVFVFAGIFIWLNIGVKPSQTVETVAEKKEEVPQAEEKTEAEIQQDTADADIVKNAVVNSYILPDSNSRYLTRSDVEGMTLQEINYAKNEIYARHGRLFKSNELQSYFNEKSWYVGKHDADTFDASYGASVMNTFERSNAEFLSEIEFSMDSKGYQLDVQ